MFALVCLALGVESPLQINGYDIKMESYYPHYFMRVPIPSTKINQKMLFCFSEMRTNLTDG